jgi:hypothetical protein
MRILKSIPEENQPIRNILQFFIEECKSWINKASIILEKGRRKSRTGNRAELESPTSHSEILELLDIAKNMPFSAPELNHLGELNENIKTIEQKAKGLIEMGKKAQELDMKILVEQAEVLGISLPILRDFRIPGRSIPDLEIYAHRETFCDMDLELVIKIKDSFVKFKPEHPVSQILQTEVSQALELDNEINTLLDSDPVDLDAAHRYIELGSKLPHLESIDRLHSFLKKVESWEKSVTPFLSVKPMIEFSLPHFAVHPADDMERVNKLLKTLDSLRIDSNVSKQFLAICKGIENWKSKVKNVFSGSSRIEFPLESWLVDFEYSLTLVLNQFPIRSCFCLNLNDSSNMVNLI